LSDPAKYTQSYNFSGFASANPDSPLPGTQVDVQLEAIEASTTELRDAIKDIRRSDGALANGIVGPDQLSSALTIGFTNRGAWAADTDYDAGDGVVFDEVFYSARSQHTSATGHEPDISPDLWNSLFTMSSIAVADGSITPPKLAAGQAAAFQAAIGTGAQLGTLIDALTAKTTPADADLVVVSDSASSLASKKLTFLNLAVGVFVRLGALIAAATAKATPVDADAFMLADSEASGATKRFAWSVLKSAVTAALGVQVAALTGKTTPIDADILVIADSAATNASKGLTFANLKAWIGILLGPLIAGLVQKSSLENADGFVISDSGAGYATKLLSGQNLKATLLAYLTPLHSPVTMAAVATTSGATKDFSTPAGCKRWAMTFNGVSTNGTSPKLVQIGDSGGIETSGYVGGGGYFGSTTAAVTSTAGLLINSILAADVLHGTVTGVLMDAATNTWAITGSLSGNTLFMFVSACSKPLSDVLTTVRLTTVNGTDAFDLGKVGLTYELG
jgi:hypothetical protein